MGEARNIRFRSMSPHSTPPARTSQTRVSLRSPIFNPYDRFTQPEFDAWIGDITGALKRALDHEAEPEVDPPSRHRGSWHTVPGQGAGSFSVEGWTQSPASSEVRDEESTFEDSFSRIASRRAKGKARDPREGPGLGLKGRPIELSSDSEEEVVDSLEVNVGLAEDSDDSAREGSSDETNHGDTEYDELDEDEEANLDRPGTSAQHVLPFLQSEDSGRDQDVTVHAEAAVLLPGNEDLQLPKGTGTVDEDGDDGDKRFAVLGDEGGADDVFPFPTQNPTVFDVELTDPWDGPRTFAEDYYSGGDRLVQGLTPNHLTPLSRSPAPTLVPIPPILSNIDAEKINLSPSPDILSSLSSLKRPDTANGDGIDILLQYGTTVNTSVNDQEDIDEPSAGVYYDNVGVVDTTVHAVRDADTEADGDIEVMKTIPISKEISTSYPTTPGTGIKNGVPGQEPELIWVPTSDDEGTDADSEEEEGRFLGAVPLGTSDLDIRDDWRVAGRPENIIDTPEEDELQEVASAQTADDVTKTAALTLSQFSESGNPDSLHAPLVDPQVPILAPTFQFPDADSFGDLPLSSPPSETPSPAPSQPTGAFELQQGSIEQLFADLEREASEKRSPVSEPPSPIDRQPEADTANGWASQQLENILSGEISVPDSVTDVSGSASMGRRSSPKPALYAHYPEYLVEEVRFSTQVLPKDDFRDPHSIPPPDPAVEMIQLYEVEEPRSDGRLTEELEITIESPREDGTTIPPPIVSSIEVTAATTSKRDVLVSPTEGRSTPFTVPSGNSFQGDISSAVRTIPAPIVADPSVPDPVLRDSPPVTAAITDVPQVSGPSSIPSAVLRVHDLDLPQGSRTSGLFTPAQRSEDGTPVLLEDEVASALAASHGRADKGLATSAHLQAEDDPSSINRFDTGAGDRDAVSVDDPAEPSQLLSDTKHHLGIGSVEIDAQKSGADGVELTDDISQPPSRGPPEPVVQLSNEESLPSNDISLGPSQCPDVLESRSSGEALVGASSIVGGDDDADGEADPDYSPDDGAKSIHESVTHQPVEEEGEVVPSKADNDTVAESENLPKSASTRGQESEAVGETAPAPIVNTSSTVLGIPFAGDGDAKDKGSLTTSAQSEVKARNGKGGLKRKRRDPKPGPARITRSKSGASATRGERSDFTLRRAGSQPEKAQLERVDANADGDSVNDGASENASVSSGASAVRRLLHDSSRAGSVVSSISGDAPSTSPLSPVHSRLIPLIHSHGLHHHGLPVPPRLTSPTPSTSTHKGTRSERAKGKSPTPSEPPSPSLRRAPNTNSPVTRSNCRFHKISLPHGGDRGRAYFVVPGCALGDGGLMDSEDIRDEGFSTHEDHTRMFPNVEALELNPYLVGVLRQLVGVDLLREQQEIFYLPSEDEKPRKRRQTGALESLRQFQRQSISSGGPLAREHSPHPSEISLGRGSIPPRSASGSAASGSGREDSVLPSEDGESALGDPDNDNEPDSAPPPAKRHKSFAAEMSPPNPNNTSVAGEPGGSAVPEHSASAGNESATSSGGKALATRRSRRRAVNYDAAAYKPSEDELKGDEEVEETKPRRSSTRRVTKRSRTMEESSANPPKSKKTRLGRAISVAGAGATDS